MNRITERTLYPHICKIFENYNWKCETEVSIEGEFPDLILRKNGVKVLAEVKIDSDRKLIDAITEAHEKAKKINVSNVVAILFPREVRQVHPDELESVYQNLIVKCLILTDWLSDDVEMTLVESIEVFNRGYEEWLVERIPKVDYDFVVRVVRESIGELASILRRHITKKPIYDSALAIIGRFDLFKLFIEELGGERVEKEIEEESKLLVADIASYIFANQILFYHIISEKLDYPWLPEVDPSNPPKDLLDRLEKLFENVGGKYSKIFGLNLIPILYKTEKDRINLCIAKLIEALKFLKPQHIEEDLLGRLYSETIPPNTRKNLGAFYTKPEAAKLLANLAIDKWDVKVLDPACGSGTLLVESYLRKKKLAPKMDKHKLHKKLLEQIYGIDIMHFAFHMASINLASQDLEIPIEPNIIVGDGVSKMVLTNPQLTLEEWLKEVSKGKVPKDFDLVIMNPPFTRRERFINLLRDEEKELLRKMQDVRGRVGYWAYFVVASDKILKKNGKIAFVAPEGFFNWEGESVRSFLLNKGYGIKYIVKSHLEFFSEQAAFRDYLVVLEKGEEYDPAIIVLKKSLKDVEIEGIVKDVGKFRSSITDKEENDCFLALKQPKDLISGYLRNLKPLVAFNTIEGFELFFELIKKIKHLPTLEKLGVSIFQYNPGFYIGDRETARYARKLFTSRYEARAPSLVFWIDDVKDNEIILRTRDGRNFKVKKDKAVCSLRTYAGVKYMDLTNKEEYAIIEPNAIPKEIREITGLINSKKLNEACRDIREAYRAHAGNILLSRKVNLTATIRYLAYYSENRVIGTTSALLNLDANISDEIKKALVLYLNSSFTLVQLLALLSEVGGAWVTLHDKPIWSLVHIPDFNNLKSSIIKKAVKIFEEIGKLEAKPLYQRIKEGDEIQRKIDSISMKMLKIDFDLNKLYDVLTRELEILSSVKISRSKSRGPRSDEESESCQVTLDEL